MINKNTKHFSVRMMCDLLSVSTSGYYDWRDRPLSTRAQENILLSAKIKKIFDDEYSRAGAKRI
jgi:putative transposase